MSLLQKVQNRLTRLAGFGDYSPCSFYSPIPSIQEVRRDVDRIFDRSLRELGGVDLNASGQLALLNELKQFYAEQPFAEEAQPELRYFFNNPFYSYADALFLYSMIRHARPKRIIEVGSGYSSFVMLDTNQQFFDNSIRMTFIDPYPQRLQSRFKEADHRVAEVIPKRVQDVELSRFDQLEANDILFIDSSHVAKVGSDINFILFDILPRLPPGVFIHFHDIHYPFQYPEKWVLNRRWFWNEAYILRSFLQYNSAFKVRIWNHFLGLFHPEKLEEFMPLSMKNIGGSIWLQRV
ncbi:MULTISPECIES: class I SAM-dependent methyltransferase [unclassified Schlesneria]|uniref:class I SAM-dependent methyltransferase n=1 Tax=Schlesneria TaxID=656899 RepID=UPI002F044EFF